MLLAEGHASAWRYPLGRLWVEAAHARDRINRRTATDAVVMLTVIVQALAGGSGLGDLLKDLTGDG